MSRNGKSKTTIRIKVVSPGQVVLAVKESSPTMNANIVLGRAVLDWTKDHPDAQVTAALPIVSGGNTVAVHLWFIKRKPAAGG